MDWMYKGLKGNVDREDYLTGRKIDKTFDMVEQEENPNKAVTEEDLQPINQVTNRNFPQNDHPHDALRKVREDPMTALQSRQVEKRKEILQNPIKLKHIQDILLTSLNKDKQKKKKKKEKKNKHKSKKKHKKRKIDSEEDSHSERLDSDFEHSDTDSGDEKKRKHYKGDNKDNDKRNAHLNTHDRRSRTPVRRRHSPSLHHNQRSNSTNRSLTPHNTSSPSRSRDRTSNLKNYSPKRSDQHSSSHSRDRRSRSPSRKQQTLPRIYNSDSRGSNTRKPSYDDNRRPKEYHCSRPDREPIKKLALSEEEKRRRFEEMTSNAQWREQERTNNVRKLEQRELEEEKRNTNEKSHRKQAEFIKPMLNHIASNTSIEDSIRQNRFKHQSSRNMDSNFARRN